jgi:hypothetical protein
LVVCQADGSLDASKLEGLSRRRILVLLDRLEVDGLLTLLNVEDLHAFAREHNLERARWLLEGQALDLLVRDGQVKLFCFLL